MPDWVDTVRLAVGAFLTSAGFGGLATAIAAWLALRGVRERMRLDSTTASDDRQDRLEADARERFWKLAMYLDAQIDQADTIEEIKTLADLVTAIGQGEGLTREQENTVLWLSAKIRARIERRARP